jgi:hypothetical protein
VQRHASRSIQVQRVERVFAYLYEVDVVLIDVKPQGQLGQGYVSKSVLGTAEWSSSAWLDAAAGPKRTACFT